MNRLTKYLAGLYFALNSLTSPSCANPSRLDPKSAYMEPVFLHGKIYPIVALLHRGCKDFTRAVYSIADSETGKKYVIMRNEQFDHEAKIYRPLGDVSFFDPCGKPIEYRDELGEWLITPEGCKSYESKHSRLVKEYIQSCEKSKPSVKGFSPRETVYWNGKAAKVRGQIQLGRFHAYRLDLEGSITFVEKEKLEKEAVTDSFIQGRAKELSRMLEKEESFFVECCLNPRIGEAARVLEDTYPGFVEHYIDALNDLSTFVRWGKTAREAADKVARKYKLVKKGR